jgi:hypothetical protein
LSLSFSFGLYGKINGLPIVPPLLPECAAARKGTAEMTVTTAPVSRSTKRVFLATGGELIGQAPRFYRAFPLAAAVAAAAGAAGAVLFVVFFEGVPPM